MTLRALAERLARPGTACRCAGRICGPEVCIAEGTLSPRDGWWRRGQVVVVGPSPRVMGTAVTVGRRVVVALGVALAAGRCASHLGCSAKAKCRRWTTAARPAASAGARRPSAPAAAAAVGVAAGAMAGVEQRLSAPVPVVVPLPVAAVGLTASSAERCCEP